MDKYLRMVFKTDEDNKVSLRVGVPRDDLDATEVKTVMDGIVAKNIFAPGGMNLTEVEGAKVIITQEEEFDLEQI